MSAFLWERRLSFPVKYLLFFVRFSLLFSNKEFVLFFLRLPSHILHLNDCRILIMWLSLQNSVGVFYALWYVNISTGRTIFANRSKHPGHRAFQPRSSLNTSVSSVLWALCFYGRLECWLQFITHRFFLVFTVVICLQVCKVYVFSFRPYTQFQE
jgi:hypothetical protein